MSCLIRQKESLYEGMSARYLTGVSEDYRRTFTPLTYSGLERKYQNEPNTEIKFRKFTFCERVSFCLYFIAITVLSGFSVLCLQEFRESLYLWWQNRKFCVARWQGYSHLSAVDRPLIIRADRGDNHNVIEIPTITLPRREDPVAPNVSVTVVRGILDPSLFDPNEPHPAVLQDISGVVFFDDEDLDDEDLIVRPSTTFIIADEIFQGDDEHHGSPSRIDENIYSICKEYKEEFPDSELNEDAFLLTMKPLIEHEQNEALSLFLTRLKETNDYKNDLSRKNLLLRLINVLKDAAADEAFREIMFTVLQDATTTCGDRVALAFNEIELQQAIECRSSAASKEELMALAIGCKRLEVLNQIAAEKIDEDDNNEQIEVYLFLRVKLREALGLPVNTEGLLYSRCAQVNDEELLNYEARVKAVTSKKEDILKVLLDFIPWKEKLKKDHKADFDAVIEESYRMHEALEESSSVMKESDYIRAMQDIQRKMEEDTAKLIHSLTEAWISEKLS